MPNASRRDALRMGCAGFFVSCSGGILRAAESPQGLPEGDAYSPWQLWDDPRVRGTPLALVSAAILAANPHDTQPWLFHIREDGIDVFADLSRNLGAMDPFVREMHLGIGCAIENALLAAGPNGFDAQPSAPSGSVLTIADRRSLSHVATIQLTRRKQVLATSLYQAIPNRHTNRYAYEPEAPLPRDWLKSVANGQIDPGVRVLLFGSGSQRAAFDAAVMEATDAIISDSRMIADSDRWVRTSSSEIERHRDGPTLEAAGLSPITLMLAKLIPVSPQMSHDAWRNRTQDQVATAPVTGLIAVRDRYDRQSAIAAGRTWQRLHLGATARGIAMQPLNQPIEMIDRERQTSNRREWATRLARLTGQDWEATFAFRAGFPSCAAPASPRRALRDVVQHS